MPSTKHSYNFDGPLCSSIAGINRGVGNVGFRFSAVQHANTLRITFSVAQSQVKDINMFMKMWKGNLTTFMKKEMVGGGAAGTARM